MPRSKSPRKPVVRTDPNANRPYYLPGDAPWGGFVDLRLDPAQRAEFLAWLQEAALSIWSWVGDELTLGLSLSIKWDAENSTFVASYLGRGLPDFDDRWCLTARADSPEEALGLLQYKHRVLMDGDWSDYMPRTGRMRGWG